MGKWARDMTDQELAVEFAKVKRQWDEIANDPDFEGHGGSPFEWMDERLTEIADEQARRGIAAEREDTP